MKYFTLLFISSAILLSACSDSNDGQTAAEYEKEHPEETGLAPTTTDEKMAAIDEQQDKMPQIKSLLYTKEDHTMVDVTAYLDENNKIVKLVDYFQEGKTGMIRQVYFYFNDGKLFASKRVEEVRPDDKSSHYSEIVTFYDESEKAQSSKIRTADFEENLEMEVFQATKTESMSPAHSYQVINQQGEYAVTFQGFVNSGPYDFLIVGENKADGFTSSISIQEPSQTILYLKSKGKAELGRPLVVSFERYVDEQGYEMQILTDVSLVENKKK